MLRAELLADLIQENGDLCKIFATSLRTARLGSDEMTTDNCQLITDH